MPTTAPSHALRSPVTLALIATAVLLAGAGRLAWLETHNGDALRRQAGRQQAASTPIPAQRGDVLDVKGRILAGSIRRPSVYVDPSLVRDPRFAACTIGPLLGLKTDELERALIEKADRQFVWVKRRISDDELEAFNRVRKARGLNAFVVRYEPQRQYLFDRLASHVIGFVGGEQRGLAGIEQQFDERLAGRDGRRVSTVDMFRRRIETREDEYVPPVDGATVVLTIDVHIQERAEQHVKAAVEQFGAEWASAVVMDPHSGEVLAMATYPDFSPVEPIPAGLDGAPLEAAQERLFNRAVSGAYEPGSVFKPFVISCAIEDGLTHWGEAFPINGPLHTFGRRTIHDTHAYAALRIEEIISKSSNIGAAMVGQRCGNARLNDYVRRFGFGSPTGITLPGEHDGLVQRFDRWTDYSSQSVPIGQEIAITPLQLVTAFAVFANDGLLVQPRIVRGVVAADGTVLEDHSEPVVVRRVLDEKTAREMREMALVEVVKSGTGKNAAIAGYQTFGKTGTAQMAHGGGRRGYAEGVYLGSFVGGAPAERPAIVAVVSLKTQGKRSYYGGTVAAPTFAKIVADALAYLRVPARNSE